MDIKIIGVYQIESAEPSHLIELSIHGAGSDFNLCSFTQEIPREGEDNWQVPYDEHFLNSDGTKILNPESPDEIPKSVDLRVAFYFHYLDLSRPIKTPLGDMNLPGVTEKPDRLYILEYDPPD
jgi:hypothetical protein